PTRRTLCCRFLTRKYHLWVPGYSASLEDFLIQFPPTPVLNAATVKHFHDNPMSGEFSADVGNPRFLNPVEGSAGGRRDESAVAEDPLAQEAHIQRHEQDQHRDAKSGGHEQVRCHGAGK